MVRRKQERVYAVEVLYYIKPKVGGDSLVTIIRTAFNFSMSYSSSTLNALTLVIKLMSLIICLEICLGLFGPRPSCTLDMIRTVEYLCRVAHFLVQWAGRTMQINT